MSGNSSGLGRAAGLLALGFVAAGCSGSDVSAGAESDAVNLNRCYGADCGVRAQSLGGADVAAQPCGEVEGPLADAMVFEEITGGLTVLAAVEGAEGTVWALQLERGLDSGNGAYNLVRFSADGVRLGTRQLSTESDHTVQQAALAVDATGIVTVAMYSVFAPNADSALTEELVLSSFDNDLASVGVPRSFRGMSTPRLQTGPSGSVWLAGNAAANASHGVVSRISQGEPDWIQTAVPATGTAIGVSGLSVADDGTAAVLAGLTPKWSGSGPNVMKVGLSTFDASGKPLWTLKLPTEYDPAWVPALGGTADGDLVVVGAQGEGDNRSISVRQVTRDGELGWAYTLLGDSPGVDVRRDSGRAFVGAFNRVAVIDRAGATCRQFSVTIGAGPRAEPADDAPEVVAEPWRPDGEYLLGIGSGLVRFRVPE